MPPVSGIILCGGLSRRMGRDKAWLPWSGRTLLSHVAETLRPFVEDLVVVSRAGQVLPATSARVVTDRVEGAGPLGGLEAGLAAMGMPYGIVVACDMPWLNVAFLKAMVPLSRGYDLVIPRVAGEYQPLHAVYAKHLQPVVGTLLARGERRVQALMGRVRVRMLEEPFVRAHDPLCRSVTSVDTQNAYRQAIQRG